MTSEPIHPHRANWRVTALLWIRQNQRRLFRFAAVGVSGTAVNVLIANLALLFFLTPFLRGSPLFITANFLGFIVSVFTNFMLNDRWTWGDREKGGISQWFQRLGRYYLSAAGAGAVQLVTAWMSLEWLWRPLELKVMNFELASSLSIMTGIGFGMVINFVVCHLWAFRDVSHGGSDEL